MIRKILFTIIFSVVLAIAESADARPKNLSVDGRFRPQSQVPKIEKGRYESSQANVSPSILQNDLTPDATDPEESLSTEKPRLRRITEMDKQIFITALPLSAIFAIIPLASAIDLFWVNRLGSTLAVAGQAAANQVYSSAFWLFAFLPSVTATLVSKTHANGDLEGTQDAVCQALFFGMLISAVGASIMFFRPEKALAVILKAGNPALATAKPYLRIRAFSFLPMLLSFVGFSAFRGTMDVQTSVKVTLAATSVTVLLEPILIYVLGIGVRGAAMATLCGEVVGAIVYLKLLLDRKLMLWGKVFRIPPWKSLEPLVTGGIALQLRSICLNFTFLMVARVIQSLDDTGVSAAAHALAAQTFQLGGIVIGALGMASQTMVPNAMVKVTDGESSTSSISNAKPLINRLLMWGSSLGFLIGLVQLVFLPAILRSSPLTDVREAARVPALIAIAFQGINGIVSVGEGVMMGSGSFTRLSINNVLAALGYLAALRVFPETHGLTGVWISLSCFTTIRLLGVLGYLFVRSPPQESSIRKR